MSIAPRPQGVPLAAAVALAAVLSCGGPPSGDRPYRTEPSPREEFEAMAERVRSGSNRYFGTARMRELESRLDGGPLEPSARFRLLMELAVEKLRLEDPSESAELVEEAWPILQEALPGLPPGSQTAQLLSNLHMMRALAYLRVAETRNCVARHTSESCLLPIRGGGVHTLKDPARQAKASLENYLRIRGDDLAARWLLNIVAMTLGEYPGGVEAGMLIPPSAFASDKDIGRFADIAPALGINTVNLAGGVVAEDFDGDGLVDIVTSTWDPGESLTFYRSTPQGRFEDATAGSGLDEQLGGLNLIGADHDADGDPDLLVLRGAWLFDDGRMRNSLLRNNGDGTFTDVTRAAGLAEPAYPTQAAAWGDFDGDGDLDLFIGNEASGDPDSPGARFPSQLFRNNGDGTFEDIAEQAGVLNMRMAKGVTVGDYDNDSDLDIYVSNIGPNRLYRNDGRGVFTDVAVQLDLTEPAGRSFAPWFFDVDNDGWLDLWVPAYDAGIAAVAAHALGREEAYNNPRLYRNNRDGTFTDAAGPMNLHHPYLPMGGNFGDIDNDGFLDIYLGTGNPDYRFLMPNVLLWNDTGRRYLDATFSAGMGHIQKGHGIGFADLDNDGDQDVYHQIGGMVPGDRFGNALFENPGHGNRFVHLRLIGAGANRAAIGARIRLVLSAGGVRRELHRAVGSVSSFGGSPLLRQEIGLGRAERIETIEVRWPGEKDVQVISAADGPIPMDTLLEIRRGVDRPTVVPLTTIEFDVE